MSNIYVKWKKLDSVASSISNYEKYMRNYSSRVESVKNTLQLSPNVTNSVRIKLNSDIEKLNELAQNLEDYSQKLKEISVMYQNTEKNMLES